MLVAPLPFPVDEHLVFALRLSDIACIPVGPFAALFLPQRSLRNRETRPTKLQVSKGRPLPSLILRYALNERKISYWNYQKQIGGPMHSELQSLAWSLGFYVFIVLDGKLA